MEGDSLGLFKKLEYVIDYMDEHIHTDLNLDQLSKNVYISKFYLHRIFKALTGDNIMTYFRKRKLSESAEYLLNTSLRVSDIACEFGFDHYQSFIRAFKNAYGMTPQQFRSGKAPIAFSEKLSIDRFVPIEGGMLQKPQTKLFSTIHLVGKKHKIYLKDNYENQTANRAGLHFFYNLKKKIKHKVNPQTYYGLTLFDEGYPDYTYYIPSTQAEQEGLIPQDMERIILPARKYYCFKYIGLHRPDEISSLTLASIWRSIFQEWMPGIGYTPTLQMERIDYGIASEHYCEVDLLYPKEE